MLHHFKHTFKKFWSNFQSPPPHFFLAKNSHLIFESTTHTQGVRHNKCSRYICLFPLSNLRQKQMIFFQDVCKTEWRDHFLLLQIIYHRTFQIWIIFNFFSELHDKKNIREIPLKIIIFLERQKKYLNIFWIILVVIHYWETKTSQYPKLNKIKF
jgi:hypothetical protein